MAKEIKETPILVGRDAKIFSAHLRIENFLNKWGNVTSKETGGHVKYDAKKELYRDVKMVARDIDVYEGKTNKGIILQTISSILLCISYLLFLLDSIDGYTSDFSIIFNAVMVVVILFFFIKILFIQKKQQ